MITKADGEQKENLYTNPPPAGYSPHPKDEGLALVDPTQKSDLENTVIMLARINAQLERLNFNLEAVIQEAKQIG